MGDLDQICAGIGIPIEPAPGGWVVAIPTAKRGPVAVQIACGERTAHLQAFVMRAPDRAHMDVYARMLRRNLPSGAWRFALDELGDIFLATDVPLDALDESTVDGLLGLLSTLIDETFEGLARTGFDIPDDLALDVPSAADQTSVDPKHRASV